jgi:Flp pilus assembly protein CpaB
MKVARLIVLGVALAAGGFGQPAAPHPALAVPPPLATVDVLVAKADLGTAKEFEPRLLRKPADLVSAQSRRYG